MINLSKTFAGLALMIGLIPFSQAQTVSDFENLMAAPDSIWNGSDLSGGTVSGAAFFFNDYNPAWSSWSGFSVSEVSDTVTRGWGNQYASIAGSGVNNSKAYGVMYSEGLISFTHSAAGDSVMGVSLTNSTFAYYSMKEGDNIAKKFGGTTGTDPDFFRVQFYGIDAQGEITDSVYFYLADYRGATGDYIVDDWTWVDLRTLGRVKAVYMSFESTDVGNWGINTPTYVCMDSLIVKNSSNLFDPIARYDWSEAETASSGNAIDVLANDLDPDGAKADLSVKTILQPINGTAMAGTGNQIDYTPNNGFHGYDTLGYVVEDKSGLTDTGLVYVLVNSAPIAVDDMGSALEGQAITIDILKNDSDEDSASLNVSVLDTTKNGHITLTSNKTLQYLPDAGYIGKDSCSYILCDVYGKCDTAWVNINVEKNTVGVDEWSAQESIHVFPNPTNQVLTIAGVQQAGSLNWYDMAGNLIRTDRIELGSNEVSTSSLQPGMYLITTNQAGVKPLRIQVIH
ncbi:DUF4465 domain-containing protein [bacterium SCSIO 12741]|nr:DUF4465 domain-containing protein [bacterium SCSIO 12741]